MPALSDLLPIHHVLLAHMVKPGGGTMLDATMGNGHDTLFLAQIAGKCGFVLAMDKQARALAQTSELLEKHGLSGASHIRLVQGDHADMGATLARALPLERRTLGLDAALFNLGFLPGGDKSVMTVPQSTLTALAEAWSHLAGGGVLSVHTYTGHPGGLEEAAAVDDWMKALPRREARVVSLNQHNKPSNRETLYLALKARKG